MKKPMMIQYAFLSMALVCIWGGAASAQELPVVKGKKVVARVDGEPITLETLDREIASIKKTQPSGATFDQKTELEVLKRLVTTLLIVKEARNIGLDKLPEVSMMADSFSKEALREELAQKVVKDVKADEKEVERIYQGSVREWKITAVLFEKEEDARSLEAELRAGGDFGELVKKYTADRRAKQGEEGVYLKVKDVDTAYASSLSKLAVGSTSSIIQSKSGFVILRLEDIRYADNPEERKKAELIALTNAKKAALKAFEEGQKKKNVKIHGDVLNSIDYESQSPTFEALLKDTRVVAEIKGDKPVTVGDMTEEIRHQFFHGAERAAERRKLNARKEITLEGLINRKLFRKEALRLGLDKSESYRSKVKDYERGILFGAFINKVLVPDIKVTEDEARAYYNEHMKDFTTPEMMKIRSLVFGRRADAESAIQKLKEGTEFQWLALHAEGQLDKNAEGILSFDDRFLVTAELPEEVRKAVSGGKAGSLRLYASEDNRFYVLAIQDVVSSKLQPFEQVNQQIAKRKFDEKVLKSLEDYADKLKSVSEVKIYLKGS